MPIPRYTLVAPAMWLLCGCLTAAAAEPPKTIFGTYRNRGSADTLKITRTPAGKVEVNVRLIFAAGHTCNLRESAAWVDNHLVVEAEGVRDGEACKLEIAFHNGRAEFTDDRLRCSKLYCGSRGTLQGAKLTKKR